MSDRSKIEWTDSSWNPIRGCTKISAGCKHCYAELFAERFRGVKGHPYGNGFDLRLVPDKLTEPARWRKTRKIFVNSMSDLFHESVPEEYIIKIATVMRLVDWHIYQILTKRSERMLHLLDGVLQPYAALPHIWWGVSAENRKEGLRRIEDLKAATVRNRFVSLEPLLEDLGDLDLRGIHWMIVGGESGPKARPVKLEWIEKIQEQCSKAGVPFFFKQWGGRNKKRTGRLLRGRTYDGYPVVVSNQPPDEQKRNCLLEQLLPQIIG